MSRNRFFHSLLSTSPIPPSPPLPSLPSSRLCLPFPISSGTLALNRIPGISYRQTHFSIVANLGEVICPSLVKKMRNLAPFFSFPVHSFPYSRVFSPFQVKISSGIIIRPEFSFPFRWTCHGNAGKTKDDGRGCGEIDVAFGGGGRGGCPDGGGSS